MLLLRSLDLLSRWTDAGPATSHSADNDVSLDVIAEIPKDNGLVEQGTAKLSSQRKKFYTKKFINQQHKNIKECTEWKMICSTIKQTFTGFVAKLSFSSGSFAVFFQLSFTF